jgi:hypothetical protein
MKEIALKFGTNGSLIGVLSESADVDINPNQHCDTAGLLFNAGLIHHIGPNRFYVKMARRMADMGIKALRFDFSGIGDSGPRMDKLPADESMLDEARKAMDLLERQHGIKAFICIGLCAGAAAAARVSVVDPRVKKMILINPFLQQTAQINLMRQSSYYSAHAMYNPRSWLKFFSFRSSYRTIWNAAIMKVRTKLRHNFLRYSELPHITEQINDFFIQLNNKKVKVLLIFAENEIGNEYLKAVAGPQYNALKQSGLMRVETSMGADHLITPLSSQSRLLELISDWLVEAA